MLNSLLFFRGRIAQGLRLIVIALSAALLASCANNRVLLEPVGPAHPAGRTSGGDGRLIAFTAPETYSNVGADYYHHSNYRVLSPDGKVFKFVPNHTGPRDNQPEQVSLPAGIYTVVAQAENAGTVSVPVVIEPLKTTEVHLERGWKPDPAGRDLSEVVRLPNGQAVGWRASVRGHEDVDEDKARKADAVVKVKLIKAPDTVGALAYALVEPVAVIRNKTEHHFSGPFTVGFVDLTKGVASGVSNVYLKLSKRSDGVTEWRLLEE